MNSPLNNDINSAKQQALALCQRGDFPGAKRLLQPYIDSGQMDVQSYAILGNINGRVGDFEQAAKCFEQAVSLQPDATQIHYGLGMAYSRLGRFPEAESAFRNELERSPGNLQVMTELAILEYSQNRFEPAEKLFNRVLDKDVNAINALIGLGRVHLACNKSDLALNYFNRAIKLNSNIPHIHHHIAVAYMNLGQNDRAQSSFDKALKSNPDDIQTYLDMGQLYLRINKIDKAKQAYEHVLSIRPDNLNAITGIAELHEQAGEIQQAYDLISPYIDSQDADSQAKHVDMVILLSRICHKFDRCDDALKLLNELLGNSGDVAVRKSKINFALGKLYDRLGRYDEAFNCYKNGNDIKANTFDAIEHRYCIERLIKKCGWNYFINAPRSNNSTERPVFIVGMPRSGTTLTEQILSSHPDVYGAGENTIVPDIIMNLPEYLGAGVPYPDNLDNLTTDILDKLAGTYLEKMNELDRTAKRTVDKTLANFLYLGLISQMFPNARIIHCKRDPRDTCLSIYFQNFDDSHNYATTLENLGHYYLEYDKLMKHWKSILPIPLLEVRYEDMVDDYEKVSAEIIDFVGLPWDENVLRFYENKRSVVTASYDQVRQKIYRQSTERWKNYQQHIEPLSRVLAKLL